MQFPLASGDYQASISDTGAALHALTYRGRDLVVRLGADESATHYRGAVLAPWPNRIARGQYQYAGQTHQLTINDPARDCALHGLVTDVKWTVASETTDEVALQYEISPSSGYPYHLGLTVTYTVSDQGLHWSIDAANLGDRPAPYGTGPHPYLRAGAGTVDDWELTMPATEAMRFGDDPTPVADRTPDFNSARSLRSVVLDHTFTGLTADPSGLSRARLLGTDGGVELSWRPDECPWVQVYTYDLDGSDEQNSRTGVAVEPMTCPPFAFNSGIDVISLQPGQRQSTSWTLSAV